MKSNSIYNNSPDPISDREVFNESEAAGYLNVSERGLRYLRQNRQIPFALIGKQIRYLRSELLDWLKAGGTKSNGDNHHGHTQPEFQD